MARSHQKYFTSDGHRMAIGQNGFLCNTIHYPITAYSAHYKTAGYKSDIPRAGDNKIVIPR